MCPTNEYLDTTMERVGRLALRKDGAMWNAYYAKQDTMDGAILLGSIRMEMIVHNPDARATFLDLMQLTAASFLKAEQGGALIWGVPEAAPTCNCTNN